MLSAPFTGPEAEDAGMQCLKLPKTEDIGPSLESCPSFPSTSASRANFQY